jgi:hypothetical protein
MYQSRPFLDIVDCGTSGVHKIFHTGFPGAAREAHARYAMRRLPIDYISDGRTAYITFSSLGSSILNTQIARQVSGISTTALPKANGKQSISNSSILYITISTGSLSGRQTDKRWSIACHIKVLTAVMWSITPGGLQ